MNRWTKAGQNAPAAAQKDPYAVARGNLLVMLFLTVVNVVLIVTEADVSFMFSAFLPQLFFALGALMENPVFMGVMVAATVVNLLVYLLCWIFSKKHWGWMLVATIVFVVDTVAMFLLTMPDFDVIGIVFHAWVLVYLIMGVVAGIKRKTAPAAPVVPEPPQEPAPTMKLNGQPQ